MVVLLLATLLWPGGGGAFQRLSFVHSRFLAIGRLDKLRLYVCIIGCVNKHNFISEHFNVSSTGIDPFKNFLIFYILVDIDSFHC